MNTSLECAKTSDRKEDSTVFYQPIYRVTRSDENTQVQVDLPGVSKDDLRINVENNELFLEGLVTYTRPENWKTLRRETRDRSYQLRLRLGDQIDQSAIEASLANGVLSLVFPKAPTAKPRKVKVK
jgi:HSP20 family protein